MKRAAIYCRVSSEGQEENASLDTQRERCLAYAARQEYSVDVQHVYQDVYSGANLWDRPALTKLRVAVATQAFDVLIVYAVDRLSRSQVHTGVIGEELARHGLTLESVTERIDDTAVGTYMRQTYAFVAEIEREKILERTRRGLAERTAKHAYLPGAGPPYGYRWTEYKGYAKGGLEVCPQEAEIVRRIFRQLLEGTSTRRIALQLTSEGIPTPKGADVWLHATVRHISTNPLYAGVVGANKTERHRPRAGAKHKTVRRSRADWTILNTPVEPIVEAAVFEAVQSQLALNKQVSPRRSRHAEQSLLRSGFIFCGHCKTAMIVRAQPPVGQPRSERRYLSYSCTYRSQGDSRLCTQGVYVSVPKTDDLVWRTFLAHCENVQRECQCENAQLAEPDASVTVEALAAKLVELRKDAAFLLEEKMLSARKGYDVALVAEALDAKREELKKYQEEYDIVVGVAEKQRQQLAASAEEVLANPECSLVQRRRFFKNYGVRVEVHRDVPGRLKMFVRGREIPLQ